jgi:hypothetical protein
MATAALITHNKQRTCEDEWGACLRLEDELAVSQYIFEEGCKPGVPVVLAWHIHGAQHTLMDVDRACRKSLQGKSKVIDYQDWL